MTCQNCALLLAALEVLMDGSVAPCWCPWRFSTIGDHTRGCLQAREAVLAARGAEADETTTGGQRDE